MKPAAALVLVAGLALAAGAGWYWASPHWALAQLSDQRSESGSIAALFAPEAVRLLVVEPYGPWQFAAAEGVPEELMAQLESEDISPMPRVLETTESWTFERDGIAAFTARPADKNGGHTYRFERDGLGWRLVQIDLSEPIR